MTALCSRRPFPDLSACVREDCHGGRCVFTRWTDRTQRAVNFYEESARGGTFTFIAHADFRGPGRAGRMEMAALYAVVSSARPEASSPPPSTISKDDPPLP